jgi:hypothetical protein
VQNVGMNALRTFLLAAGLAIVTAAVHASMPSNLGFGDLEQSLRLNPEQKVQFDAAVSATQRAFLSVALAGMQMKDRIGAELAKPRPDLDALARLQEDAVEQTRPLFREAHVEWARLYAMLDPAQVRIARAHVEEQLERFERMARSTLDLFGQKLKQQ